MEFHMALNQTVVSHSVKGDKSCLGHSIKPTFMNFKVYGIKSTVLLKSLFHTRKRQNKTDICACTCTSFGMIKSDYHETMCP